MEYMEKAEKVIQLMIPEIQKKLLTSTNLRWTIDYLFDRDTFQLSARTRLDDGRIYAASVQYDLEDIGPNANVSTTVQRAADVIASRLKSDTQKKE